jgi:hypothetical protein
MPLSNLLTSGYNTQGLIMGADKHEEHFIDVEAGYEKRDVNLPAIIGTAVVLLLIVAVSIVILDAYFAATIEGMRGELGFDSTAEVQELRAEDEAHLNAYGKNEETGEYHIPIDKAIELVVKESGN